jgi:hypothetical protein
MAENVAQISEGKKHGVATLSKLPVFLSSAARRAGGAAQPARRAIRGAARGRRERASALSRGPLDFVALALIASNLPARRSLARYVRAAANASERGGAPAGRLELP